MAAWMTVGGTDNVGVEFRQPRLPRVIEYEDCVDHVELSLCELKASRRCN